MGILRARMEQDLVLRGRSEHTRRAYLRAVADLARSHHRSPDQLSDSEVQQYLRYLIDERCLAWASCRQTVGALRFFYEVTLGRPRRAVGYKVRSDPCGPLCGGSDIRCVPSTTPACPGYPRLLITSARSELPR